MDSLMGGQRARAPRLAVLLAGALAMWSPARTAVAYEGYGYQSVGGVSGPTVHVTNLGGGTSNGSFRWALAQPSPKRIVFDVGGTIQLSDTARISGASQSFVTIDGTTAPSPGITIRPSDGGTADSLYIENGAHDVIVTGLRFVGFDADGNGGDLLSLYGAPNPVYNVVIDHCTFENGDDGALDITNTVTDTTISWNFFHNDHKSELVKYGPRNRLSFHHNVYASNPVKGERNPLLWGDTDNVDFVNNINYGWQFRGLEIRHEGDGGSPGKRVNANIVNNLFTHQSWTTNDDGLVYGMGPGPDSEDGGPGGTPPQGTVVTNTNMGKLWVTGNILPPQNRDHYSTIAAPLPVPGPAQVTTWPAVELKLRVLPSVGTVFRTAAEQALLDQIVLAQPNTATMSIDDAQVTEGDTGSVNATFTVRLSLPTAQVVTVQYATAAGTATAASDYTSTSGTLTFPTGATSRTVPVAVLGDVLDEPDETFVLNLSTANGAALVDAQAQATIVDNDPTPLVSIASTPVPEGDSGTTDAVFTVSMLHLSASAVTVPYATVDGTALAGNDYTPRSGVVTFAAGTATPQTITVPVLGDTLDEPNERFSLGLSVPANAVLFTPEGVETILDDDGGTLELFELPHGADLTADLQAQPGPVADRDLYVVPMGPYSSYEILVDQASGAVGTGTGPRVERVSASDLSTVLASSQPVGAGPARSLRLRNSSSTTLDAYVSVRSNSCGTGCGPEDVYRIRSRETTASVPRFNQENTQRTVLVLQNRSAGTIAGTVHFWRSTGVHVTSQAFSAPARATFVLIFSNIPALTGLSGTITVEHDGRYGDLEGKSVALESLTGYSFDTPLQYRQR